MSKRLLSARDRQEIAEITDLVQAVARLQPEEVDRLLADVRANRTPSSHQRLVEDNLGLAFDEAIERSDNGVDVKDLFQESTLAVTAAVSEYASRDGSGAGLSEFTRRMVAAHLDATLQAAEIERRSEEAFVRDAQLYETAEVALRRKLGREATPTEVASVLEWPTERVELVAGMLGEARKLYDSEIALFLDEAEEE